MNRIQYVTAISLVMFLPLVNGCDAIIRHPFQVIESLHWPAGEASYHADGREVSQPEFDAIVKHEIELDQ